MITDINGHNIRNLVPFELNNIGAFNVIIGTNGAGKTSLLEAISLLSATKSFRTHHVDSIININKQSCYVFACIETQGKQQKIGIQKFKNDTHTIRINNSDASVRQLVQLVPIKVINQDNFNLINGSAKYRRQFLDWGVFYHNPQFIDHWRTLSRVLKQRNAWLKLKNSYDTVWDKLLIEESVIIHQMRLRYLQDFMPVFTKYLSILTNVKDISITYYPGWDDAKHLADVLDSNLKRDKAFGTTHNAPHKAELIVKKQNMLVKEVLSRGQQKLVACALQISQGQVLARHNKEPVYIIDDLASELDTKHQQVLLELLKQLNVQIFITSTSLNNMQTIMTDLFEYYFIDDGVITRV